MFKENVAVLLNNALEQHPSLFLIDFTVDGANRIRVVLDGDQGVDLQNCMDISRAIEHHLDREEADFSLEVTSSGATSPLQLPRQFKKNVGRKIAVEMEGKTLEGTLAQTTEKTIVLEWKAREPKPIGKGKITVRKKQEIAFSEIKKATVVLKF